MSTAWFPPTALQVEAHRWAQVGIAEAATATESMICTHKNVNVFWGHDCISKSSFQATNFQSSGQLESECGFYLLSIQYTNPVWAYLHFLDLVNTG